MNYRRFSSEGTPVRIYLYQIALLLAMLVYGSTEALAQQEDPCSSVIEIAKRDYQRGFFDEASFRLSSCISRGALSEEDKREAYLLLGQIYYANLELEKARDSVRALLEEDPSLELTGDEYKSGFVDLFSEVMQEVKAKQSYQPPPPPKPPIRDGFWLSTGFGPAEGNIRCDCPVVNLALPDDHPWKGGPAGSFVLAMGATISPRLQIGGEINVWSRSEENRNNTFTSTIGFLSFIAKYYTADTGNFFLKGGIGFGSATLENDDIELQAGGAGLQFGLGYDILLGPNKKVALTPVMNLNVLYVDENIVVLDNIRLEGPAEPSFFQVGLTFTWL